MTLLLTNKSNPLQRYERSFSIRFFFFLMRITFLRIRSSRVEEMKERVKLPMKRNVSMTSAVGVHCERVCCDFTFLTKAFVVGFFFCWRLPCWQERNLVDVTKLFACLSPASDISSRTMNLVSAFIRKNGKSRFGMLRTLIARRFSLSDTFLHNFSLHPTVAHRDANWRKETFACTIKSH